MKRRTVQCGLPGLPPAGCASPSTTPQSPVLPRLPQAAGGRALGAHRGRGRAGAGGAGHSFRGGAHPEGAHAAAEGGGAAAAAAAAAGGGGPTRGGGARGGALPTRRRVPAGNPHLLVPLCAALPGKLPAGVTGQHGARAPPPLWVVPVWAWPPLQLRNLSLGSVLTCFIFVTTGHSSSAAPIPCHPTCRSAPSCSAMPRPLPASSPAPTRMSGTATLPSPSALLPGCAAAGPLHVACGRLATGRLARQRACPAAARHPSPTLLPPQGATAGGARGGCAADGRGRLHA